jgi:hypothetical protein
MRALPPGLVHDELEETEAERDSQRDRQEREECVPVHGSFISSNIGLGVELLVLQRIDSTGGEVAMSKTLTLSSFLEL